MGSWWDIEVKAMKMKILPAFIGSHEPSTMKIDRPCMIDQFGYWDLLLGFVQATVDFAKENRAMKAPLCGDTNHQGWNGCLPECRSSHLIFGRFNGENDLLIPQNHVIFGIPIFRQPHIIPRNPTRNPSLYVFEGFGPRVSIQTDE